MLETIGHYRIRQKIGRGAMGVVYEGWDDRLQRPVAVKTIDETNETSAARSRLWREARSLARVNHPNVCQVYDVLEEGEVLVLVMELLDGLSLADYLLRGIVEASQALKFIRQILQALQALHALGIIHRDLKPSNVFMTAHGIKLLDFGLAHTTGIAFSAESNQTATVESIAGGIVGTPSYMSPEQASGLPVGPASDIFSVGCVFYELLTGKQPFEGNSLVDILYAVLHQNPPPLSGSLQVEALDQVLRRAMAKRVGDRFTSASEMLEALELITLSENGAVAPRTRTVSRIIVLPFRAPKSDEQTDFLTFALPDAISNSLSAMNNLIIRSSFLAARFESQPDPKRVAIEADVDAFLTGSLLRAGDRFRLTCQLIEAPGGTVLWSETANSSMQDLFTVQDELCERILQSLQVPLDERDRRASHRDVPATTRAYECYFRATQITVARTLDNMGIARDLYLQCLDESPDYAPAWVCLGRVYHFLGKFGDDARGNEVLSEKAFHRAFALNPELAIAHNFYTPVECDQGHAKKAMVRLLERARFRRNDAELFAGLVQACRYCDELDASIAAHFRGRHLDPHLATSAGHTYFLMGNYTSAIELYSTQVSYYLDCAALAAMGESATALSILRERERSGGAVGAVQALMRSLRAYLEGNTEECVNAIVNANATQLVDPEVSFYAARHFARVGQTDRAISALSAANDRGFLCASALARDTWFDSLRSEPRYAALMQDAERRRGETHAAFLAAGGLQVIGIA
jgi:serine/threonine protein kinase/tetratricopeptide (TPR) repeat protein